MALYTDLNQYTPEDRPLLEDDETIYQSLNNILSTRKGERLFKPDFGLYLPEVLFEIMDDTTELDILRIIGTEIKKWEPRIRLDYGRTVVTSDPTNHAYAVQLVYSKIDDDRNNLYTMNGVITQ